MVPISPPEKKVRGMILAGGKSSRFGEDKAMALFNGRPMLQGAVDLLASLHLDPCVITSAVRDYSFLNCEIKRDLPAEKGPLGGIYTAFSHFGDQPLLFLTCDMPLLTEAVLQQLIQSHTAVDQATVFSLEEKVQPFPGIYEPELKTLLLHCLESRELSMKAFLSRISHKRIVPGIPGLKVFQNVNHPEDLRWIAGGEGQGA